MTTASKTASTIRNILKDYNVWPEGTLDSQLKVFSSKSVLDDVKLLSIDKSLQKKYQEVNPLHVLPDYKAQPSTVSITVDNIDNYFLGRINRASNELKTHIDGRANLLATGGMPGYNLVLQTTTDFQLVVEKLEFFCQLYSNFKALENPKVWTIYDSSPNNSDGLMSIVIGGEFGQPTSPDFRSIYASTLVNSL